MLLSAAIAMKVNAQSATIIADIIKNSGGESEQMLFQLSDSTIMQLKPDGNVKINANLEVQNGFVKADSINARVIAGDSIRFKGTALFDTIKIKHGYMLIDSICARVIHVGDISIVIDLTGLV